MEQTRVVLKPGVTLEMDRPVLYLDVDGTISPDDPRRAIMYSGWGDYRTITGRVDGETWPVSYSSEMLSYLGSLDVQIIWATMWTQWALDLESEVYWHKPIGYLDFDRREEDHVTGNTSAWAKYRGILEDQRTNPKDFIWLDDRAVPYFQRDAHLRSQLDALTHVRPSAPTVRSLLIAPKSEVGLTVDHMTVIEKWIKES